MFFERAPACWGGCPGMVYFIFLFFQGGKFKGGRPGRDSERESKIEDVLVFMKGFR